MRKYLATSFTAILIAAVGGAAHAQGREASSARVTHSPKVLIVTMFGPESRTWLDRLGPWQKAPVPGLLPEYPAVNCNASGVCVVTTGMGHSHAAASITALLFSRQFDFSHTYFIVSGIAGINPEHGTLGSVAWARYLVDFGLQWELDAREIPATWTGGYLGINTKNPADKPVLEYRSEVFQLNEALLQRAYALSRDVVLSDSATAQAARAHFSAAPASAKPTVLMCDTVTNDTWFSGARLGQRATDWTRLLTDGQGVYCTSQQEDNATYEALERGASARLVDLDRVAVLRAGSDFDRPHAGQTAADNLVNYVAQGGFPIALQNLFLAADPLVQDIVARWPEWRHGVPKRERE